jgi:hypothetical protein
MGWGLAGLTPFGQNSFICNWVVGVFVCLRKGRIPYNIYTVDTFLNKKTKMKKKKCNLKNTIFELIKSSQN